MTALERARGWFIAPPDATRDERSWCALNSTASVGGVQPGRPDANEPHPAAQGPTATESERDSPPDALPPTLVRDSVPAHRAWRPPVPEAPTQNRMSPSPVDHVRSAAIEPAAVMDVPGATEAASAAASDIARTREMTHADEVSSPASAIAGAREVTSAAVLGRSGEVEPVAAALALALRRQARAATATVALVGPELSDVTGGGRAARRLAERLDGQGFEARVRGRLAWVRLDPGEGRVAAAARRLSLIGAPAVLAVSAPRSADTDEALLDCDLLVIVAGDPDGPLTRLAASGLAGVPIVTVRRLGRGPARALARAGVRSTRSVRQLLSAGQEQM